MNIVKLIFYIFWPILAVGMVAIALIISYKMGVAQGKIEQAEKMGIPINEKPST